MSLLQNMARFETAFQTILPHFMDVMITRNYNGYAYMIIDNEWKLIEGSDLYETTIEYSKYIENNRTIIDLDLYNRLIPHISIMSKLVNCKKFNNRIINYIVNNVPNSASNHDMTHQIQIDCGGSFIEMIKNNILLPEERILEIVAVDIPEVLTNPSAAKILLKYIDLFTHNHILIFTRFNIKDEFCQKKSLPIPRGFRAIREEDERYFQKKVILDGSLHIYRQCPNLKSMLEDLFYYEMKLVGIVSSEKWLCMYNDYFRVRQKNMPLFCENWENYIPEFLSDNTNYLTYYDKKTMDCIPLLFKNLLQKINHDNTHKKYRMEINKKLEKLEKYISYQ